MVLFALMFLPTMTVACAVIALVALWRDDMELAALAAGHMAAIALANIATWFTM